MKRLIVGVSSTVLAFTFLGGGSPEPQNASASGGIGEDVYRKSCIACHGADGNSGRAPDLVTESFKGKYKEFAHLKGVIQQYMPKNAPGSLTAEEYQAVSEYLWKLNGNTLDINNIRVFVNKNELSFTVPPVLNDGTTLVPLREIFEALGAEVKWDQATKTVTALKAGTTVKLTIGSKEALVGTQKIALAQAAQIIEGKTFVPLRFVSEALGAKVDWDAKAKVVTITQS